MTVAERRPPRAAAPPDGVLLPSIARGDLAALGVLYDRHASDLLRFARRLVGSPDADDLVQATFLRVVRVAGTFDPLAASARPWLLGIAWRIARERRRSLRRFAQALVSLSGRHREPLHPALEERRDLEQGLLGLTLAKRTTLLLAEIEGFTCEEIATLMAVPVGTVWTRLHHARRDLRRFYEGDRR